MEGTRGIAEVTAWFLPHSDNAQVPGTVAHTEGGTQAIPASDWWPGRIGLRLPGETQDKYPALGVLCFYLLNLATLDWARSLN